LGRRHRSLGKAQYDARLLDALTGMRADRIFRFDRDAIPPGWRASHLRIASQRIQHAMACGGKKGPFGPGRLIAYPLVDMLASLSRLVYGPTKEERVQEVQRRLRQEQRALDREIRQMDQAMGRVKQVIKRLARKGDDRNAIVLAKEVVRTTKHRTRLVTSKAQLNSISLQLQQQLSMYKVTGHLQRSTEIMKLSNALIRIPQMTQSMREMSQELTKAGILEEMMQDTLEASVLADDDPIELEAEADAEVHQVLYELTDGKLGEAGTTAHLPQPAVAETASREQDDLDQIHAALHGLLHG